MKKIIFISVALVLVLVCLVACNNVGQTLSDITELLNSDYSSVTVKVTTETAQVTLNGTYIFNFDGDTTTIEYSYDKLNELSADGNNADSFKSTVSGTATVQGNSATEDGVTVDLPLSDLDFAGLSFKEGFFENIKASATKFEADVIEPKGFTGNNTFVGSDMRVAVTFNADSLTDITITYVSSSNANVTVSYSFTK